MIAHGKRHRLTPPPPCSRIVPTMPVESETVPVGSSAPDFTLTSIDGQEVKLSNYRGRKVVLVFLRGFH
ncbi:MAG: redoxin domain-containing protein [Chloroflexi bacterium]|nr:redoxin domain-containing protein [Chloroflexota bacterium]